MQKGEPTARRWQILVCRGGTVHIHYGTGSLHVMKQDFPGLAEDLRAIARSIDSGEACQHPDLDSDHIH